MRLIHGDCLIEMKQIPDGSVDAVVTDPPYGMGKFDNDDEVWGFIELLPRILACDAAVYVFCGDNCYVNARRALEKSVGFNRTLVWDKTVWQGGGDYQLSHEYILFAKVGNPALNTRTRLNTSNSMKKRGKRLSREKSVWKDGGFNSNCSERIGHPAQKPLSIISKIIGALPAGATVLDPFMGSGTTGVACVNLKRKFIGIELDEKYFELAQKRIREASAQMTLDLG